MSYLEELRSMSGVFDYSDRNKLLELAAAKTAETFCAVCEVYAKKGELSHTGPALFAYNDKHYGIKFYPDERYQIGGNECSLKRSEVDRFINEVKLIDLLPCFAVSLKKRGFSMLAFTRRNMTVSASVLYLSPYPGNTPSLLHHSCTHPSNEMGVFLRENE